MLNWSRLTGELVEAMNIVYLPAATLRTAKAGRRSFWANMVIRIMMLLLTSSRSASIEQFEVSER
jgi:hypothetical protein